MDLISRVYDCDFCKRLGLGFTRPLDRKGFFKFPPTIGSQGIAPLLFIGINPRISNSNMDLHETLMRDEASFRALSRNWLKEERYIRPGSDEGHYTSHIRIVRSAFGNAANFEEHAAVTELYFCATEDADGLSKIKSPCANTYLDAVLAQVKPRLIVAVGKTVMSYLRWKFEAKGDNSFCVNLAATTVPIVRIVHPNDTETGEGERERLLEFAIQRARALTAKA